MEGKVSYCFDDLFEGRAFIRVWTQRVLKQLPYPLICILLWKFYLLEEIRFLPFFSLAVVNRAVGKHYVCATGNSINLVLLSLVLSFGFRCLKILYQSQYMFIDMFYFVDIDFKFVFHDQVEGVDWRVLVVNPLVKQYFTYLNHNTLRSLPRKPLFTLLFPCTLQP